ncbi:hypothetical protein [Marivirga sp.]|uniref:hypothetical protein n=1 Tax=Marivirga sp. TaxID=2018662 RepID=UPI0025EBBE42|nr:hypothetical protein [Marivirga sp.]
MGIYYSAKSYCYSNREGRVHTGYCTEDPDYHNGQQFCHPGGFTCDGDDIYEDKELG